MHGWPLSADEKLGWWIKVVAIADAGCAIATTDAAFGRSDQPERYYNLRYAG